MSSVSCLSCQNVVIYAVEKTHASQHLLLQRLLISESVCTGSYASLLMCFCSFLCALNIKGPGVHAACRHVFSLYSSIQTISA